MVENQLEGDELRTDVSAIESQINKLGPDNIVCVMTTTSCFTPRVLTGVWSLFTLCSKSIWYCYNNDHAQGAKVSSYLCLSVCLSVCLSPSFYSCNQSFFVFRFSFRLFFFSSFLEWKIKLKGLMGCKRDCHIQWFCLSYQCCSCLWKSFPDLCTWTLLPLCHGFWPSSVEDHVANNLCTCWLQMVWYWPEYNTLPSDAMLLYCLTLLLR